MNDAVLILLGLIGVAAVMGAAYWVIEVWHPRQAARQAWLELQARERYRTETWYRHQRARLDQRTEHHG